MYFFNKLFVQLNHIIIIVLYFLSFQNDNLYVTTVNFRLQESECFDELKAPPSSDLHVDLPPNGTCSYGNGTCPTSDYSEDPCTPGLASSENFPLLSGHRLETNGNANLNQETKMLTVDCGEGKALLDGHPYSDVGYNHTGSPLSVASGGSYWTTGGDENESVSYHRMSPKGLALCEGETDEQWDGARGAAGGEPSSPDSPSRHMDYSMMGKSDGPLADHARTKPPATEKENLVSSPTSPTSPVALYSMQASALDPMADEDSITSDDDLNDISSYVRQTTASSLGLLVPVPKAVSSHDAGVKKPTDSTEKEKNETDKGHEPFNRPDADGAKDDVRVEIDDDAHSVDSEECVDDALDPYVQTGATKAPQSPQMSLETQGTAPVENYVQAGCDNRDRDFDSRRVTPRVRSASGGALDTMRRTHSSAPDFLEDSDSAISMEDADLQYVQAGCADELFNPSSDMTAQNSAVPTSPVLPGVAIDFSDGSGDEPVVNRLALGDGNRSRSVSGDRQDLSDNDLSDLGYEKYNDDSIDGYVTQAQGVGTSEPHPMLPYIAIDLAEVPQKSRNVRPAGDEDVSQQRALPRLPQPVCVDSGYVPQSQAHMMGGETKDESPKSSPTTTTEEKSAYDNPEYGVLAQCLSELERKQVQENDAKREDIVASEHEDEKDAASITGSNESLTGSPTNNNSPYVPHGKAPLGQMITRCPGNDDSGYLPHSKIPGQLLAGNVDVVEVNGTVPDAHGTPPTSPTERGYIPINNIPAV